jgi:hypothetical protein
MERERKRRLSKGFLADQFHRMTKRERSQALKTITNHHESNFRAFHPPVECEKEQNKTMTMLLLLPHEKTKTKTAKPPFFAKSTHTFQSTTSKSYRKGRL